MAPRLHQSPKRHDRFTPHNNVYVEQKHQNTTEDCHQPKPPLRNQRLKVYPHKNPPVPSYHLFFPYLSPTPNKSGTNQQHNKHVHRWTKQPNPPSFNPFTTPKKRRIRDSRYTPNSPIKLYKNTHSPYTNEITKWKTTLPPQPTRI